MSFAKAFTVLFSLATNSNPFELFVPTFLDDERQAPALSSEYIRTMQLTTFVVVLTHWLMLWSTLANQLRSTRLFENVQIDTRNYFPCSTTGLVIRCHAGNNWLSLCLASNILKKKPKKKRNNRAWIPRTAYLVLTFT
jgi:hypothetical protein